MVIILLANITAVAASVVAAQLLRFGNTTTGGFTCLITCVFVTACALLVLYFYGFFQRHKYVERLSLFFSTIKAWFVVLVLYVLVGFLTKYFFLVEGRLFVSACFAILFILFMISHQIVIPYVLDTHHRNGQHLRQCTFIGPKELASDFEDFVRSKPLLGFRVSNHTRRAARDNLTNGEVFLYSEAHSFEELYKQIVRCLDGAHQLHVASPLFDELRLRWEWSRFRDRPIYSFQRKNNIYVRSYVRRAIDIIGSAAWIFVLLPFFLVIAIAIKIDSKGPVFFRQKRCGCNGKEFVLYKFRSMVQCGEEDEKREHAFQEYIEKKTAKGKIVNHEGITYIGSILRRTSLDELPQLWNVLRGDMSLVGPRPPIPYEVKHYKNWHLDRLSVKPGLTGLWQVRGRGVLPCDHSVFLDLMYTINRSLSLDVKLILETIPSVVFGKGAY